MPDMARSPASNEPVESLSHPIKYGPAKPPMVPMELMKASPAAAPTPLRKRVGIGQKIARAEVMPTSATVIAESPRKRLPVVTEAARPAIPTARAMVRLPIFLPVRSTRQDHHNMPAEAKT